MVQNDHGKGVLRGRGIGFQLNFVIVVGVIVMVSILMGIVAYLSFTNLTQRGEAEKFNELGKMSSQITLQYQTARQTSADLAQRLSRIMAAPAPQRNRNDLQDLLGDALLANDVLAGIGLCFEPNAFDGRDASFANTPLSDASGRVITYALRDGGKQIGFFPLKEYENADWYQRAKKNGKPELSDPFLYEVNGRHILMVTLTTPIIENGRFIGAIMADLDISKLQGYIESVSSQENFYVLFTGHGITAAHGLKPTEIMQNAFQAMGLTEKDITNILSDDLYALIKKSSTTGEEALYVYSPVHFAGIEKPWAFLSVSEYDLFVAPARRMIYTSIMAAIMCTLLLIVSISIFTRRRLMAPIEAVSKVFRDFADLDLRPNPEARGYMGRGE